MHLRHFTSVLVLAAGWGLLAGCESVRDTVRDRFTSMPPQVRVVQGDAKQVFAAARLAMARFGYEMVRGGAAQGEIEGVTRIGGGEDFRSSQQREITIHLESLGNGSIAVRVVIKEIVEDEFSKVSNPATETPVRDTPVYDAFFEELQRQLQGVVSK